MKDVTPCYRLFRRFRLLLTGWSLVRIRPGEPPSLNAVGEIWQAGTADSQMLGGEI